MDHLDTEYSSEARSFAQKLVDAGEYPTITAAASDALMFLKAAREREKVAVEREILQRDALPRDRWPEWTSGDLLREYKEDRGL